MEKRWHASYSEPIRRSLDYPDVPLPQLLSHTKDQLPNRTAIHFLGKKVSYEQLHEQANTFAGQLARLGIVKGDRVALMLPNIPQYIICYYGILIAGGTVVQINPLYGSHDLKHTLKDSGARTIVCLDLVYPRVSSVTKDVSLKTIIVTGIQDFLPFPKNILYPLVQKRKGNTVKIRSSEGGAKVELLQKLLSAKTRAAAAMPAILPSDDVAVLQYTGGTTGVPKAVMLTHSNLNANVIQCKEWMHKAEFGKETVLAVVPLFHVYGMTVCMNYGICMGATIVLIPKFEINMLMKTIDKQKPSVFPGAPTLYIAILNDPNAGIYDLSSIECCISGSAPLPLEVQERFERVTGGKLVEGYGLSEASPVTHANPIWGRNKNGSIGIPWPDTDSKIVDEEGREAPVGEVGEIVVKGPQVMKGYWNRPEDTESTLIDGWLRTGDIGMMDEDGYFYIVDRKKDVIIAGGFKVYPREIEEVLYRHPAVREAAVIGIPDDYRGETVKAFIVTHHDLTVTEAELNRFCREQLASYKVPRVYEFRSELPKSIIGKVLRRVLADEDNAARKKEEEDAPKDT